MPSFTGKRTKIQVNPRIIPLQARLSMKARALLSRFSLGRKTTKCITESTKKIAAKSVWYMSKFAMKYVMYVEGERAPDFTKQHSELNRFVLSELQASKSDRFLDEMLKDKQFVHSLTSVMPMEGICIVLKRKAIEFSGSERSGIEIVWNAIRTVENFNAIVQSGLAKVAERESSKIAVRQRHLVPDISYADITNQIAHGIIDEPLRGTRWLIMTLEETSRHWAKL